MESELAQGPDLEQLFGGTESAGQGNEGIRQISIMAFRSAMV